MSNASESTVDVLQRFSRRSMIAVLFIVALLGGTGLALILSPEGAVGRSAARAAWLIPVVIVIAVAAIQTSLRQRRWNPASREVQTVLQDEFRQANLDRAARISLIVILAAQWPLALAIGFLGELPNPRAVMAMATSSITFGLLTFLILFLYFDRD